MAKSPSLADNLGKHLECAVCLEQYTEPKVLPCLHSFCKRCLQGLLTQEGAIWKINCPTCRSKAEVCFNPLTVRFFKELLSLQVCCVNVATAFILKVLRPLYHVSNCSSSNGLSNRAVKHEASIIVNVLPNYFEFQL